MWYVHFCFQQNIALFCAILDFVVLLLFADASYVSKHSDDPESVFFQGRDIGPDIVVTSYGALGLVPLPSTSN